MDHVEPDKIILEKSQKANDSAIISEIDQTMKRHTDSVLHAIDGLSARLSQLENRTRHLEHSVDELKLSIGNNHGSTDGKMRQLENILLEVFVYSLCLTIFLFGTLSSGFMGVIRCMVDIMCLAVRNLGFVEVCLFHIYWYLDV